MNVLIVEDEPHTARLLKEIIEQDSDYMVVQILDSIADTIRYLQKYQQNIDLIFLDIHLSDGPSFEIFKHLETTVPIVFCTAYDSFTLEAIKHNGIDYILKPFKDEEVFSALHKYKQLVGSIRNKLLVDFKLHVPKPDRSEEFQESFLTQQKEKSVVVYTKDIALFMIELETVYLLTFEGKKSAVFKNLEYIESVCDPQQFFRINRQMLVNRTNIVSIEPFFGRKAVLHLKVNKGEKAIVSRLKVSALKAWIEKGK